MSQEGKRNRPRLEDVPELMQHIQSRLPLKQATRTSILSKSWLHASSTIPNLRFHVRGEQKRQKMKLVDVEHTLTRYLSNNIPFERFQLKIDIENEESASAAKELIRSVATKTCLKELCLKIRVYGASLHLPDEILSGENLTKIRVSVPVRGRNHSVWMTTTHHPKCVSLRELHIQSVGISEEVLHDILSSCRLLVKIELVRCLRGFNTIKVKNLPRLQKLLISERYTASLEINNVKNLQLLTCNVGVTPPLINPHSISLGSRVKELTLGGGVITDNASLEMIFKSRLPFLQSLTLDMSCWTLGSFHFKCASIKRFSLLGCPRRLVHVVDVKAPKLKFFSFSGSIIPSLLFPDSTLKQMEFNLRLKIGHVDASFFLKMRDALTLSSRCNVHITLEFYNNGLPFPIIDIHDLRTRLPFPPAKNVQKFSFRTSGDECLWERSPFFGAFFEICHPKYVSAWQDSVFKRNNHFCKLMLSEVLEKNNATSYWPFHLEHVQIKQPPYLEWETLTDSHTSFLDGPPPVLPVSFIPKWR